MKEIKISIVIPVYNASKYLSKCLDSVINQSYSNIEIVLVDDGSRDNSGNICDEYSNKDKRIKVIHKENGGVSYTRNTGIKKATGDYITFVDSDDLVHSDYVRKLVENVDSDTLSVCQIENFYDKVNYSNDLSDEKLEFQTKNFIELCRLTLLNTPCCKLFNLDILRKNKIMFDTKLSLGEDLLFNLDYLKYVGKIVVTNNKLYFYRRSDSNTLSTAYNPNMASIQTLLFDRYTDFFEGRIDDDKRCLFDSYRLSTITIVIENEFKNKDVSFIKRYFNVQKLLRSDKLRKRILTIRYPKKKFINFLIRHRLILTYKIVNKIKSII